LTLYARSDKILKQHQNDTDLKGTDPMTTRKPRITRYEPVAGRAHSICNGYVQCVTIYHRSGRVTFTESGITKDVTRKQAAEILLYWLGEQRPTKYGKVVRTRECEPVVEVCPMTETLKGFGFTTEEATQIHSKGWIRHQDNDRFGMAMLKAAKSGWSVSPPNWPSETDPESGWYISPSTASEVDTMTFADVFSGASDLTEGAFEAELAMNDEQAAKLDYGWNIISEEAENGELADFSQLTHSELYSAYIARLENWEKLPKSLRAPDPVLGAMANELSRKQIAGSLR
jgi:hypothetical protein